MMNVSKYKKQYYLPPEICMDWAKKDYIDKGTCMVFCRPS